MALPGITLPAGFPVFQQSGHGVRQDSLFSTFKPKSGHARVRRIWTIAPRTVSVELFLTRNQTLLFHQWFEDVLIAGELPFSARVASQGGTGLLWWYAEWKSPPSYDPRPSQDGLWRVSGELILTGSGSVSAPENGTMSVEFSAYLSITAPPSIGVNMAAEFGAELNQSSILSIEFTANLEQYFPSEASFRITPEGDIRVTRDGSNRTLR